MKMIRSVYIIILSMLIVMCSSWKCYAAPPGMQGFQQHEFDGGSGGANKDTSLEGNAELGLPTLDNSYKPQISLGTGENRVSNIISTILSFLTIIGVCMFVVAIAVIGFDTMMGSANEKAIAKEKYVGLFLAAVLLVGASSLAKIIIKIAEGI